MYPVYAVLIEDKTCTSQQEEGDMILKEACFCVNIGLFKIKQSSSYTITIISEFAQLKWLGGIFDDHSKRQMDYVQRY